MRALIPNIISEDEIPSALDKHDWNHPVIKKILSKCSHLFDKDVKYTKPSYINYENRAGSHEWHVDTGSSGHMAWCKYGISVLVGVPESGGLFKYRDPDIAYTPKERYLSAVVHSSDQEHMREETDMKHKTILIFLG